MHNSLLFLFSCLVYQIGAYVHPGLLVSESDITRIIAKLDAQAEPWTASWQDLTSLKYSQANYTSNAVSVVYRSAEGSNAANAEDLWHDAAAAFNLALRWKIENDTDCASTAAGILVDWANTLTSLGTSDDQYLTSGLQGHELANAAELLLDYSPFVEDGFSAVSDMLTNIFLAKNIYFLNHQAPSEHNHKHFFANWELANLASAMAIGVVTDNQTAFDYAIDYFKNGTGNGAIMNAITNLVEEPGTGRLLGQGQEAGRDQGHAGLDFQLLGVIGQQAYNQGEDLYGYADNRILQGAEYYARYNLGYDVPFENYTNNIVYYTEISNSSRGAYRPTWELLYNHYAVIKASENLNTTWTKGYRNYTVTSFGGYEGGAGSWGEGSGHYDGLGWGTLLYRMDESDIAELNQTSNSTSLSTSSTTASTSSSSILSDTTTASLTTSSPTSTSTSKTGSKTPCTFSISSQTVSTNAAFKSTTSLGSSSSSPSPTNNRQRKHGHGNGHFHAHNLHHAAAAAAERGAQQ